LKSAVSPIFNLSDLTAEQAFFLANGFLNLFNKMKQQALV